MNKISVEFLDFRLGEVAWNVSNWAKLKALISPSLSLVSVKHKENLIEMNLAELKPTQLLHHVFHLHKTTNFPDMAHNREKKIYESPWYSLQLSVNFLLNKDLCQWWYSHMDWDEATGMRGGGTPVKFKQERKNIKFHPNLVFFQFSTALGVLCRSRFSLHLPCADACKKFLDFLFDLGEKNRALNLRP